MICVYPPTRRVRVRAAILHGISSDTSLTLQWVRRQQRVQVRNVNGVCPIILAQDLRNWSEEFRHDATYRAAMRQATHPIRMELHWYIIEHSIAMDVVAQHRKGLRVPTWFITRALARKWEPLPRSKQVQSRLMSIREGGFAAKNFMRQFRKNWNLKWGPGMKRMALSPEIAAMRAAIFLRWAAWSAGQTRSGEVRVVINMDETRLSNIRDWAVGIVRPVEENPREAPQCRRRTVLPRTSLIAAVCNDPSLQPGLPQIRLPRGRAGAVPRAVTSAMYAHARHPQEAWHGTDGNMTVVVMKMWLSKIKAAIHAWKSNARIVIVFDVCRQHVHTDVLRYARRLGLEILLIPAKLTWLLQPLDTHCFAQLKRVIRDLTLERSMRSSTGWCSRRETIQCHGEAIRQVLCLSKWTHACRSTGMDGCLDNLRQNIRFAVHGCDLSPRFPSETEMQEILQKGIKASRETYTILRCTPPPDRPSRGPCSVAAASAAASAGDRVGATSGAESVLPPARESVARVPRGFRLFPRVPRKLRHEERAAANVIIPAAASPADHAHPMITRSRSARNALEFPTAKRR